MNKVVLDSNLISRLENLDARIEFRDEAGRTLGFFVPATEHERLLYEWAKHEFTDEELERARRESGGLDISQVLGSLAEG